MNSEPSTLEYRVKQALPVTIDGSQFGEQMSRQMAKQPINETPTLKFSPCSPKINLPTLEKSAGNKK